MSAKIRICIIGGGPAGLTTLRAFQSLDRSKFEITCYERYASVGGIWNFNGKSGTEDDGLEAHSAMYENLIANNPKQIVEIPEFLFPEEDQNCYPERAYTLSYLNKFAENYDLKSMITFNTWVDLVTFDHKSGKFHVQIRDLKKTGNAREVFDYVIVATGHFTYPNYVKYHGEESFPGIVIHSKFFQDAKKYTGKRVLVVGSSYSAEDIAIQSIRAGAKHVTISFKTASPAELKFPEGVDVRPIVQYINKSVVSFIDGSSDEYDVIIYCTGYLHSFPFLEKSLQLKTINRLAVPLYKGVLFPENNKLFYIGMQNQVYTFSMFWLQGHLCATMITGEYQLPSKSEMKKDIEKSQAEEAKCASIFDFIDFQTNYVNELSQLTVQVNVDAKSIAYKWVQDRVEDIKTYKQKIDFKSIHR